MTTLQQSFMLPDHIGSNEKHVKWDHFTIGKGKCIVWTHR